MATGSTVGSDVFWVVATAEKLTAPFTIRVHGRSGHASMPGIADNALVKAAKLIERIAAYRPEPQIQQEVEVFLRAVLGEVPSPETAVARARERDRTVAEQIEPLLAPTFAPTMISASRKRNVIPALCEIVVDCRLLPGQTPEEIEPIVRERARQRHRVRPRVPQGGGRHALGARHAALGGRRSRSSRSSSRRAGRCR